jgi:hypothetical protein
MVTVLVGVLSFVILSILFAFGLAGPGTFVTQTTLSWAIVILLFAFGLFKRRPADCNLTLRDIFILFACAGIYTGIGIAIRVLTGPATPTDIAFMLIDENEEYLGGRLQVTGYGIAAFVFGALFRDICE